VKLKRIIQKYHLDVKMAARVNVQAFVGQPAKIIVLEIVVMAVKVLVKLNVAVVLVALYVKERTSIKRKQVCSFSMLKSAYLHYNL